MEDGGSIEGYADFFTDPSLHSQTSNQIASFRTGIRIRMLLCMYELRIYIFVFFSWEPLRTGRIHGDLSL